MNAEQFLNTLGQIDEKYLQEALSPGKVPRRHFKWVEFAACLSLVCALAVFLLYGILPRQMPPELPPVVILPSEKESEDQQPTVSEEQPTETLTDQIPTETTEPSSATEPPDTSEPILSTEPPDTSEPILSTEPPVTEPTAPSTTELVDLPPSLPGYPALICINGIVYEWQPDLQAASPDVSLLTYLGTIGSCCVESELPDEHLEANEAIVGAQIYTDGEHMILIYNDELRIYTVYLP